MDNDRDLVDVEKLWPDLINDALDPSQRRAVLNQVASDLQAAMIGRPAPSVLLETMRQIFGEGPLTEEMWPAAERALMLAYGPAAVQLISWLTRDEEQMAQRLDEISPMLDPGAETLLRTILTQHAEDLTWSSFAWNFSAHEWRSVNVRTRRSLDETTYFTEVTLEKVNGEKFTFESRANQMLLIGRVILKALNDHPSSAFTEPDTIEYFLEQARRIVDTLSAPAGASHEQAPSGAADELTSDETRIVNR